MDNLPDRQRAVQDAVGVVALDGVNQFAAVPAGTQAIPLGPEIPLRQIDDQGGVDRRLGDNRCLNPHDLAQLATQPVHCVFDDFAFGVIDNTDRAAQRRRFAADTHDLGEGQHHNTRAGGLLGPRRNCGKRNRREHSQHQ